MQNDLNLRGESLNATMQKFGAPATSIRTYEYWSVLLRPAQVTLGSLVLIAHEQATAFSELSQESFVELSDVIKSIEQALKEAFGYEKLNYLMLMMVDPDVHFHVIPRYSTAKTFQDMNFVDHGWPGPPALNQVNETDDSLNGRIMEQIGRFFT